jgi:hypothetical protein
MMSRIHTTTLTLIAIALALSLSPSWLGAVPQEAYEGQVVSVTKTSLTMVGADNTSPQRTFAVTQNTKIMRDGRLASLRDIQPGDIATITTRPLGDKILALTITAVRRQ